MMAIIIYFVLALWTLVFFVAICVAWALTVWWDRSRIVVHKLSRAWALGYFRIVPGWKLKIDGGIDKKKTYVVVANHRSMLDIVLMYALPLHNFKWVSKKEVYRWPLFGWVLWMHGDVAIERGSAAGVRKMIREGRQWLRRGVSIVAFPEGTRNKSDGLGKFREGAFMLAREAGVEILPVVMTGTDTALEGGKLNLHNAFTVNILLPMEPDMEQVRDVMCVAARADYSN